MVVLKLICGIILLILGFVYLYRPKLIIKINLFAKEFLFNDTYILLHRKKIGVFFIVLSVIAIYMAWSCFIR
ncbi:MAG: hypothetical protein JW983_02575 [Elusimicrobia bacterium]|nr:hypothetical protein [Elusimicrobiota bacterium]